MNSVAVVAAAGGNATAIETLDGRKERSWYEARGKEIEKDPSSQENDVEQVGFLIPSASHFEQESLIPGLIRNHIQIADVVFAAIGLNGLNPSVGACAIAFT